MQEISIKSPGSLRFFSMATSFPINEIARHGPLTQLEFVWHLTRRSRRPPIDDPILLSIFLLARGIKRGEWGGREAILIPSPSLSSLDTDSNRRTLVILNPSPNSLWKGADYLKVHEFCNLWNSNEHLMKLRTNATLNIAHNSRTTAARPLLTSRK